jgi:uncharacterized phosphosugar-binding protein
MTASAYFAQAAAVLQQVAETQGPGIALAADLLADTIAEGRAIFSFGASHSFMTTEELVYRTGGLMLVNPIYPQGMNLLVRPITLTSQLERLPGLGRELLLQSPAKAGDALLLTSTSGRNAVVIDMALAARERGMPIIGLTALAYSHGVQSRHPSGKKLLDLCDVVLDNCAPLGDAAVALPGLAQKIGPLSSLTGVAIVNALVAETVAKLLARGIEPPVFMSANLDGGDAWNARLLAANAHRIHYMT